MNILRWWAVQRGVAMLLVAAMLLPVMAGCASPTSRRTQVSEVMLAGIVVDGTRAARGGETGLVRVVRDGSVIDGQAGMVLHTGDRIQTGPNADILIRFPSGSELLMRPNSRARIGSISEAVGEFFAKIKGVFAVETTFVRAGARGTQYLVRAAPDGATTVVVFEGSVAVDSTGGLWRQVMVEKGQMVVAHPRAPVPMPASALELERTVEWVERIERLLPPPPRAAGSNAALWVGIGVIAGALLLAQSRDKQGDAPPAQHNDTGRPPAHNTPSPAPALTAPATVSPGATEPQRAPSLYCSSPVKLDWQPVNGAHDYVVTLQVRPANSRTWQRVSSSATAATESLTGGGLNGSYEWTVQARNANGLGPSSAPRYFNCSTSYLR